jgi:hypothetical protein
MSGDISLPATPDSLPAPDISARPWEISEITQDIIGISFAFLVHALDISYSTSITYDFLTARHLKKSSFLMLAAGAKPVTPAQNGGHGTNGTKNGASRNGTEMKYG